MNIYERILKVMGDVAYIQKGDAQVNNQYKFVSHDAVSKVLHPALVKHGIVVIPSVTAWSQDGNRTSVDIDVAFVNAEKPDDKVIVHCFGFGIDGQDKGPGKAVSYATKYAMLKTFVLETGEDPERDSIDYSSVDEAAVVVKTEAVLRAIEMEDWLALCLMDRANDDVWTETHLRLSGSVRSSIKKLQAMKNAYISQLDEASEKNDASGFVELTDELTIDQGRYLYNFVSETSQTLLTAEMRKKAEKNDNQ